MPRGLQRADTISRRTEANRSDAGSQPMAQTSEIGGFNAGLRDSPAWTIDVVQ